ncbi:hypothetical protein RM549_15370 [Salegentibacter sp. F188]|uniref:NlpE C-terminal OB domain-containing protein n=1 Tax=Autumnicola patrickiae TaxID=3075591 RepID=A0ABU3E5B1_9FLAO|nr:hypothetical protein [Salegentibacter sp. F188]MDT0691174.1 hypothetical protein [Salegentibacter sp. F188]
MKKLLSLFAVLLMMISCQDEDEREIITEAEPEEVVDSIPTLTGEFIYVADAGVFRGRDFVYGVRIDSMAQVLADEVKPYQKEDFDMVKVKIKGKIEPSRRQEGWKEVVEIREILEILEEKEASEINK